MNIDDLAEIIKLISPNPAGKESTAPFNRVIWSASDVGHYLRVAGKTVREHYASRPDFPAPFRLPSKGRNGQLRWKAAEIISWVESRR